jgi:hypothetical protein
VPNPVTSEFMDSMRGNRGKSNFRKSMMHPEQIDNHLSSAAMEDESLKRSPSESTPGDRCVIS